MNISLVADTQHVITLVLKNDCSSRDDFNSKSRFLFFLIMIFLLLRVTRFHAFSPVYPRIERNTSIKFSFYAYKTFSPIISIQRVNEILKKLLNICIKARARFLRRGRSDF